MPEISVTKVLNMLEIRPAHPVASLLMPELVFKRVQPNYSFAAKRSSVSFKTEVLYRLDVEQDVLWTFAGLLDRVVQLLRRHKFTVRLSERGKQPTVEPVWDNLAGVQLRDVQIKMLATMVSCDRAQIDGCTGVGKTMLITQYTKLYPQQDYGIIICAQQVPVVRSIYRAIAQFYPDDVGKVGDGARDCNRITVATAKSLLNAPVDDCRVLIFDEVHTAAAEKTSEALILLKQCKMFGFSASTEKRTDRADLLAEALFGPVRVKVPYAEAQVKGYVAAVDAYFYNVEVGYSDKKHKVARKRELVWRNLARNEAIARVVRHWEKQLDDPQILIMTDAVEHVFRLHRLLPDYEIIYASLSRKQLMKFIRWRLIPENYRPLNRREKVQKQIDIEEGRLKKVISTTTLGVGVDLRELDVFVRADGGSSEISNIQFRGRVTRGARGVYCDFWAVDEGGEQRKSQARMRSCKRDGWDVKRMQLP